MKKEYPLFCSVSTEVRYEMHKSPKQDKREKVCSLCCLFLSSPKLYTLCHLPPSPALSLLLLSLFGHPLGPSASPTPSPLLLPALFSFGSFLWQPARGSAMDRLGTEG